MKPNYKVMSLVGLALMLLGAIGGNPPFLTIGILFFIIGIQKKHEQERS